MAENDGAEHEWLQVTNRRWCLCCNAFQSRPTQDCDWRPGVKAICPMTTEYAARKELNQAMIEACFTLEEQAKLKGRPLCRICLGENPKPRPLGAGRDFICDACWMAAFTDRGCGCE